MKKLRALLILSLLVLPLLGAQNTCNPMQPKSLLCEELGENTSPSETCK